MGLGELVSSLFALNSDNERERSEKRIQFSLRKKSQVEKPDISQTNAAGQEALQEHTAIVIDPRMHFAMSISRNIERCVFKLLSSNTKVEPSKEYFRARDREYDADEKQP